MSVTDEIYQELILHHSRRPRHYGPLPDATHAAAGGNGLGMIFCNRVMQSFGGGIRIESTPGAGTTVTLEFPHTKTRMHSNRSGQ